MMLHLNDSVTHVTFYHFRRRSVTYQFMVGFNSLDICSKFSLFNINYVWRYCFIDKLYPVLLNFRWTNYTIHCKRNYLVSYLKLTYELHVSKLDTQIPFGVVCKYLKEVSFPTSFSSLYLFHFIINLIEKITIVSKRNK